MAVQLVDQLRGEKRWLGKGQVRGFRKSRLEVRSNCFVKVYYLLGFSADLWRLLSIEPVWSRESDSREIKVHLM